MYFISKGWLEMKMSRITWWPLRCISQPQGKILPLMCGQKGKEVPLQIHRWLHACIVLGAPFQRHVSIIMQISLLNVIWTAKARERRKKILPESFQMDISSHASHLFLFEVMERTSIPRRLRGASAHCRRKAQHVEMGRPFGAFLPSQLQFLGFTLSGPPAGISFHLDTQAPACKWSFWKDLRTGLKAHLPLPSLGAPHILQW